MSRAESRIPKHKIQVQIRLNDGTDLLGYFFVLNNQRMSDLLNDGRRFLPLLGMDGLTRFLRVENIAEVSEVQQDANQSAVTDPYEILGVSRTISDDDLLKVYHDLCRQFHPDRITQYDLPKEMVANANAMTMRVIDAYNRIKKSRAAPARKFAETF